MAQEFITNQEKLLTEVANNILPTTDAAYFLVGYFYFSGFREIYEKLEDKHIQILVGLELEHGLLNRVKEVEFLDEQEQSRGEMRTRLEESFVQFFNNTGYFDDPKQQAAFKLFYQKIKDGSLEIRKTHQNNHAKLYLFQKKPSHSENGELPGTVVTGSSNLSYSGMRSRFEVNVILRDKTTYAEGREIFRQLWEKAVVIADQEHLETFHNNVIRHIWYEKQPMPYDMFIRVLHEYFYIRDEERVLLPSQITRQRYQDFTYQTDAIRMAMRTLQIHNGVIIADVVGLGKSIIASALAHNMGLKTYVIAPPHLTTQWDEEYRDDFNFNAKVFSSGSIDKALEDYERSMDGGERLIIIDEAHKYRNENTQAYADLHTLCQGNKVILLSATPFNNKPQDIYTLIKLFQIPARSTLKTVSDLSYSFEQLIKEHKAVDKKRKKKEATEDELKAEMQRIARKIRAIIAPLVIRRSRIDLQEIPAYRQNLKDLGIDFPKVEGPFQENYDLGELEPLYLKTLDRIYDANGSGQSAGTFQGVRYKPIEYVINRKKYQQKIDDAFGDYNLFRQSQENLAAFMRQLLVRRFESSIPAFQQSLNYMLQSARNVIKWMDERGKVPIYKKGYLPDIENLKQSRADNPEEELEGIVEKLKTKGLFEIDVKDMRKAFRTDLEKDIRLLEGIRQEWFGNGRPDDPKIKAFTQLLKRKLKEHPKRKMVVFSEFGDTINYLYEQLSDALPVFKYTARDASAKNKETIKANFDAGLKPHEQRNDYQVLLATDAISEGYNLHRAGIVFNYDIPYNPTRVIQRVGRINRINKKMFDTLYIYHYFPTSIGERETATKSISRLKMTMIQAILGEDFRVITTDEQLQGYFREQYQKLVAQEEAQSWSTPYEKTYQEVVAAHEAAKKQKNPPETTFDRAMQIPRRSRIRRQAGKTQKGVLAFGRKGQDLVFRIGENPMQDRWLSPEDALPLFEAKPTENPYPVSDQFQAIYDMVKQHLFQRVKSQSSSRLRQEVLEKIQGMLSTGALDKDYLQDLQEVVKLNALPEHTLRFIKKLTKSTVQQLPQKLQHRHLTVILKRARSVDEGQEVLILSEELG